MPADVALYVLRRDGGCVAPLLGGSYADCWGRNRIEHVKAEPRMGKRAEPVPERLVTLCEGHTEPGMKAGVVWCTTRENRQAMREYLRRVSMTCSERDAEDIEKVLARLAPDMKAHPEEYTREAFAKRWDMDPDELP